MARNEKTIGSRSSWLVVLFALGLPSPAALADRGEVGVEAGVGTDVAWLLHPIVHEPLAPPLSSTGTLVFVPRLRMDGRYGVTNELALGFGVDFGGSGGLRAAGVVIDGYQGDLLTGAYGEVALPLSLRWRFDSGMDVSLGAEVAAYPLVALWAGNALVLPSKVDAAGLPARLPVDVEDAWVVGGGARVSGFVEWRVFDLLMLGIAPSISGGWAGTVRAVAGVSLTVGVVGGVGPL